MQCDSHSYAIFFFISQPPPRSTLFPYTTLFRSLLLEQDRRRQERAEALDPKIAGAFRHGAECIREGAALQRPRDRQSTRLNSSHVATPYAVFRSKKKSAAAGGRKPRRRRHLRTP